MLGLTPKEIMDRLEERVGPEGRKLFEQFLRKVNKLQALQQLETQAQMGVTVRSGERGPVFLARQPLLGRTARTVSGCSGPAKPRARMSLAAVEGVISAGGVMEIARPPSSKVYFRDDGTLRFADASGKWSPKLTIRSARIVLRPAGMHSFMQRPRKLSGSTMGCRI
jgi:hypothetical protein